MHTQTHNAWHNLTTQTPRCDRVSELLRTVVTAKPRVALLEPEVVHGRLTMEEVRDHLCEADMPCEKNGVEHPSKYAMWGLDEEVTGWGYELPPAPGLYSTLFEIPPVEWNRIGAFQVRWV